MKMSNSHSKRAQGVRTSWGEGGRERVHLARALTKLPPETLQGDQAHIVDSEGTFSQQIDVVVIDRQYTPLIFEYQGQIIVPAESVYAVFEAKQTINSRLVEYAQDKVASVRRLFRTSLPIPHAGGVYPPKPLPSILGGILALDSEWSPPLGEPLRNALQKANPSPVWTSAVSPPTESSPPSWMVNSR